MERIVAARSSILEPSNSSGETVRGFQFANPSELDSVVVPYVFLYSRSFKGLIKQWHKSNEPRLAAGVVAFTTRVEAIP